MDQLCLSCGICCNGVLFKDVELQPDDDPDYLRSLQIPLIKRGAKQCFKQPCSALDGFHCRIYENRPQHCRNFECALYKSVCAGRIEMEAALRLIRTTLKRAERVRRLLRQLGNAEEHLALSVRFRRTSKRLEAQELDDETAEVFGQLTLAVHDLNVLLHDGFYPGVPARE